MNRAIVDLHFAGGFVIPRQCVLHPFDVVAVAEVFAGVGAAAFGALFNKYGITLFYRRRSNTAPQLDISPIWKSISKNADETYNEFLPSFSKFFLPREFTF
jgi:hypothetical protein